MQRLCKVAIVAVIGPLTMLHLEFFLKLAAAAAHARATSSLSCLCPMSTLWNWSQVRSWSSGTQIAGSPFSPKWKCRIVVVQAVLILLPHESAAIVLLCWIELGHMPIPACPLATAGRILVLNNFIVWCLVFNPFCITLHVGVSFATLLPIFCAQHSHQDPRHAQKHIVHGSCVALDGKLSTLVNLCISILSQWRQTVPNISRLD